MKVGDYNYFCNCLLRNFKEHLTAADDKGNCVYCRYAAINRRTTESDIRCEDKYGEELKEIKTQHLEMVIKDKRHKEKVQ